MKKKKPDEKVADESIATVPTMEGESLVIEPKLAAKQLRISLASLYKGMSNGEVPSLKIGRRRLIPRKQFEAWISGGPVVGLIPSVETK
jgi:excisionase family DNA binding protein